MSSSANGSGGTTSAGSSTEGLLPMADHDAFDGFLNTLENLIESNGVDNYLEVSDDLCEAVEGLNEVLELNFNVVQQATLHWDGRMQQRPRAFQQMIHLLKSSGVEKNLWKRIMPSLIFARLTNKGLKGAERWKPPRARRKRKHVHKKKKLAGMTYIISVKKMLKQALEENDKEAVDQIMVEMRRNLPFGSSASIVEGVQEFHGHDCEERSLRQKQKKLRHCYFAKVGKGSMPKLADEHFCTVNRRFILPFRNPNKVSETSMQDHLKNKQD